MYSVTRRIRETKQPRGGYIKPSSMMKTEFSDYVRPAFVLDLSKVEYTTK